MPKLKVVPAVIRQSDSVNLSCELPGTTVSLCYFCVNTSQCTWKYSESCRLALSGNNLTLSGHSGIATVELKCHYNVGTQSPSLFSHPTSVTIVGKKLTSKLTKIYTCFVFVVGYVLDVNCICVFNILK